MVNQVSLPLELSNRFEMYPENQRRPVNKTLFKNDYFQLTYNIKTQTMTISSRGELVYSAIPYDTARNYIQRAAIQYLLYPEEVHRYIELHKINLEKYIVLSIFQVTKKRVTKDAPEVIQAYNEIKQNPLFEIQILGRLLQHDETGPLSANLAGKFLLSENARTGISAYVLAYIQFVIQLTQSLPIMTDGKNIQLLTTTESKALTTESMSEQLTSQSAIQSALDCLPNEIKENYELVVAKKTTVASPVPVLRSKVGKELSELRKNYIAHSMAPKELEKYFDHVLSKENSNHLNVVSDIHAIDGKLPLTNNHFTIFVGDISNSKVADLNIQGIYVIGNHELLDVLPDLANKSKEEKHWEKWQPFFKEEWFEKFIEQPEECWDQLPTGEHAYYHTVKKELEKRFPKMTVLNNAYLIHQGVRYIGLTIPVALVARKVEQQIFIFNQLKKLLNQDKMMPTIIVSYAPLFNELSLLSPKSQAYNQSNVCTKPEIEQLFASYNIKGVIHGHHHIPASEGRYKFVEFGGKQLFVVCSIYSKMNTGFELSSLLTSNE